MPPHVLRRAFAYFEWRRARRIARLLRHHVTAGETVLDIGCGSLVVGEQLQVQAQVWVIGLDTINYRKRALPMVLYADTTAPFKDQSFDAVVIACVLHHCDDGGLAVLREAHRLARHKILLLEDSYDHAVERLLTRCVDRLLNRLEHPQIPVPCRFRSSAEWVRLLRDLGMRIDGMYRVRTTPILETRQVLFVLNPHASGPSPVL